MDKKLTAREFQVLKHLVFGQSNKEIATALELSPLTVKNHVQSILKKLNARNRQHAVYLATLNGLVDPPHYLGLTPMSDVEKFKLTAGLEAKVDPDQPFAEWGVGEVVTFKEHVAKIKQQLALGKDPLNLDYKLLENNCAP